MVPRFPLVKDGTCLPPFIPCFAFVAWILLKSPRVRVMSLKPWLTTVMFALRILLVTKALTQLPILVDDGSRMMSSLLDVIFFGLVVIDISFCSISKNLWLPSPTLRFWWHCAGRHGLGPWWACQNPSLLFKYC